MVHGLATLRVLNGEEPRGRTPKHVKKEPSAIERVPPEIALNPYLARQYINSPWEKKKGTTEFHGRPGHTEGLQ
jgi:hypothetical protein